MSLRKSKTLMESTDSSKIYNRARKYYLEGMGEISCVFCPYHEKENAHKYQRSWKKKNKNRKQFRKVKSNV